MRTAKDLNRLGFKPVRNDNKIKIILNIMYFITVASNMYIIKSRLWNYYFLMFSKQRPL